MHQLATSEERCADIRQMIAARGWTEEIEREGVRRFMDRYSCKRPDWVSPARLPGFDGRTLLVCAIDLVTGCENMLGGCARALSEGFFEPELSLIGGPHESRRALP